jgi:hypothetical protein
MHFPRLTREEEIALAKAIEAGKEAQQKLADGAYSDGEREALGPGEGLRRRTYPWPCLLPKGLRIGEWNLKSLGKRPFWP